MTREERLALYWSLLEGDLRNKYTAVSARLGALAAERRHLTMPSVDEMIEQARAGELASTLDLIHTAMRELGLHYPTGR